MLFTTLAPRLLPLLGKQVPLPPQLRWVEALGLI